MKKDFAKITFLSIFSLALALCYASKQGPKEEAKPQSRIEEELRLVDAAKRTSPEPANLEVALPPHLTYHQTVAQLKQWREEAPDLVEVEPYGQTTSGTDIFYIKVANRYDKSPKPTLLMMAAIHGNERG